MPLCLECLQNYEGLLMKCPFCQCEELKVTDSRDAIEMNAIRRRRECLKCQERFTTFETIELSMQVHKRDGRFEDFLQSKLINGLIAACRHTKISNEQVIALASEITGDLVQRQVREISTRELGDMVMQRLQSLDSIAYIRFACVYQRFQNIEQLIEAIQAIRPKDSL